MQLMQEIVLECERIRLEQLRHILIIVSAEIISSAVYIASK